MPVVVLGTSARSMANEDDENDNNLLSDLMDW